MWNTAALGLLAGLLAGNGLPHFVKGITRERYPTVFGGAPVINFLAGWTSLVLTGVVAAQADLGRRPILGSAFVAVGVLASGIFHASHGAAGSVD